MSEALVLDASALVDALLGNPRGHRVRNRIDNYDLHSPATLTRKCCLHWGASTAMGI